MTRARREAGAGLKVRWRRIFWLINCVGWFASDQGCARSLMVKKHKRWILTELTIDFPLSSRRGSKQCNENVRSRGRGRAKGRRRRGGWEDHYHHHQDQEGGLDGGGQQ